MPALLLSLALGQASISNVYASHEDPLRSCICGMHMEKVVQTLHLSQDQKDKIKDVIDKNKEAIKSDVQQMRHLRSQIRDLIISDDFTEDKVNSLIDKKKELVGTITKTKIMAKHQIFTLLDTRQKAQYKELMQKQDETYAEKHK